MKELNAEQMLRINGGGTFDGCMDAALWGVATILLGALGGAALPVGWLAAGIALTTLIERCIK